MVDFSRLVKRPEIKPEIAALIKRGNITVEEMRNLRANSYEWEAMVPALSIEALIERANQALDNCPRPNVPAQSYTEAVHAVFAPELIKRLREYAEHVPVLLESNKKLTSALSRISEIVDNDETEDVVDAVD